MNQSDAFVAAWLPGTEAQGIADVLISDANGDPTYEFVGKLLAWPGGAVNARNADQAVEAELFPRGYGLTYEDQTDIAALTENPRNEKDGLISPSEGDTGGAAGGDLPDELWVLKNGAIEPLWDRGIGAFDEAIGWDVCLNDNGQSCPSIDWQFVSDTQRGQVLEVSISGAALCGSVHREPVRS